jgi:UDP-N-acetylglucosamine--N-acetylmuramyl-(pentapeptide) pyrophosphoryl-undecaprenol N-acetylglucosamine transferase
MSAPAFVFAGGGSGGHIFPALAIHEALTAKSSDIAAVFVCSNRPLDAQILTREKRDFRIVPARPISLRPRGLIAFMRGWGPSVRAGRSLIREMKSMHGNVQVVAMGGFVAAPIAQAARSERRPVTLVNLDAVPGKANRLIARQADRIISAVPVVGPCERLNWPVVPPIVRAGTISGSDAAACRVELGLDPGRPTLLVTGGSQGAVSINQTVLATLRQFPDALAVWQVIHQTGQGEDQDAALAYQDAGIRAIVQPFFESMGEAWRASDLAVSRAGAGGVAEAWAYGVPTLFMPNPYHKDRHQRHNAARLEQAGAARIVEDKIDAAANAALAGRELAELLTNTKLRHAMKSALARLGPADGAAQIASVLLTQS